MIVSILIFNVLLPLFFVLRLWKGSHGSRLRWGVSLFAAGSYLAFAFLIGVWYWTGYPLRFVWPLLLLGAAAASWRRVRSQPLPVLQRRVAWVDTGIQAVVGGIFLTLAIVAMRGYGVDEKAIDLTFPLRDGVYVVGQGGNSSILNGHQTVRPQRHALDIVRLNRWGTRARGLYPADPARYAIFGDTIFSPCTGTVADSRDGLPDLSPPARDEENVAGNYVALECGGAAVLLAHLRSGSLRVGTGDKVATGQLLGQVGNSGNTSEPHLHIHVERAPYGGERSTRPGLPMRFDGRFLVRNSVVFSRP
jgi:hypothetical protein